MVHLGLKINVELQLIAHKWLVMKRDWIIGPVFETMILRVRFPRYDNLHVGSSATFQSVGLLRLVDPDEPGSSNVLWQSQRGFGLHEESDQSTMPQTHQSSWLLYWPDQHWFWWYVVFTISPYCESAISWMFFFEKAILCSFHSKVFVHWRLSNYIWKPSIWIITMQIIEFRFGMEQIRHLSEKMVQLEL